MLSSASLWYIFHTNTRTIPLLKWPQSIPIFFCFSLDYHYQPSSISVFFGFSSPVNHCLCRVLPVFHQTNKKSTFAGKKKKHFNYRNLLFQTFLCHITYRASELSQANAAFGPNTTLSSIFHLSLNASHLFFYYQNLFVLPDSCTSTSCELLIWNAPMKWVLPSEESGSYKQPGCSDFTGKPFLILIGPETISYVDITDC